MKIRAVFAAAFSCCANGCSIVEEGVWELKTKYYWYLILQGLIRMIQNNSVFNIKYEIFDEDIDYLKTTDNSLEYEEIYGLFTINIKENEYILYPDQDDSEEIKRSYSESLITHFIVLNEALKLMNNNQYVAIKYLEDSTIWLEFRIENDIVLISKVYCDMYRMKDICANEKYLRGKRYYSFKNVSVPIKIVRDEIRVKSLRFIDEIRAIDSKLLSLLKIKHLINLINTF
ncbi:hypothetical protein [Metabacillus sp. Hm71]|uniref:hypothetical protein n=1 Tax=Metabacillus sp. Hm71 TaxID=3450743 RepID=UPI003F41EA0B